MRLTLPILLLALGLPAATLAQSNPDAISIDNAIQELSRMANPADPASRLRGSSSFVTYHGGPHENTKGSRLLFADWPKGFVIGVYDTVLNNRELFLNFDKITHDLYFTFDGKQIIKVETSQAREIHFTTGTTPTVLVRVDGIEPHAFFQRLSDSAGTGHYILYRHISTVYHRANFQTDGLVSTGNDYDEYVDDYAYFIVMPDGKFYSPIKLKRSAIRSALDTKADSYIAAHKNEPIDEAYLTNLVNWLNRN